MAAKKPVAKKKVTKKIVTKKKVTKKIVTLKSSLKRKQEKPEMAVEVHATGEVLQGDYCNIAVITHTKREFVLDFLLRLDNFRTLTSRVITSPEHAKEINEVLGKNIGQYEKKFGEIKLKKSKGL